MQERLRGEREGVRGKGKKSSNKPTLIRGKEIIENVVERRKGKTRLSRGVFEDLGDHHPMLGRRGGEGVGRNRVFVGGY